METTQSYKIVTHCIWNKSLTLTNKNTALAQVYMYEKDYTNRNTHNIGKRHEYITTGSVRRVKNPSMIIQTHNGCLTYFWANHFSINCLTYSRQKCYPFLVMMRVCSHHYTSGSRRFRKVPDQHYSGKIRQGVISSTYLILEYHHCKVNVFEFEFESVYCLKLLETIREKLTTEQHAIKHLFHANDPTQQGVVTKWVLWPHEIPRQSYVVW